MQKTFDYGEEPRWRRDIDASSLKGLPHGTAGAAVRCRSSGQIFLWKGWTADLRQANLVEACLRGVDLWGVDLREIELNGCRLAGTRLA
ncbi:MAG: pentapeptide repeat-containing protein [Thermogemmatispora sp.]|uniref:pentapeptide repeat-containing protein n=1 Tax=Thermogemmatispora sp. TaxID=1968838 RepID=UPI00341EB773|nr:pentapeptide repeat-containing protein [Thermogemmatispora sp.]